MHRRWALRGALLSAAAGAACLALATPAWAVDAIPLHQSDVTAVGFDGQDCEDERFDNLPAGYDGWHFVLPGARDVSGDFLSLMLNFTDGGGLARHGQRP